MSTKSAEAKKMRAFANKVEKKLKSGEITGLKRIRQNRARVMAYRYHADRLEGKLKPKVAKVSKVKPTPVKRAKKEEHNPNQFKLPNFLKEMKTVRMEELVAERVRQTLQAEVNRQADVILSEIFQMKKAK